MHVIFLVSLNYVSSDLLYFVAIEMLVSLNYNIFKYVCGFDIKINFSMYFYVQNQSPPSVRSTMKQFLEFHLFDIQ